MARPAAHAQHPEFSPLIRAEGQHDASGGQEKVMRTTNPVNLLWFAAAASIVFGAFLGAVACLTSFEWVDSLEMCYLLVFGALLAVLDMPNLKVIDASHMRLRITRYMHLLTRVSGKSIVLFFLGCALFSAMWSNLEHVVLLVLAVVIGVFVAGVGLISIAIGLLKSTNLDRLRQHFRQDGEAVGHNALLHMYERHARLQPQLGMTPQEFNEMATEARGIAFERSDLPLIFNALSSSPKKDALTLTDLHAWVQGSMVFL
jgi:hypothetical protein